MCLIKVANLNGLLRESMCSVCALFQYNCSSNTLRSEPVRMSVAYQGMIRACVGFCCVIFDNILNLSFKLCMKFTYLLCAQELRQNKAISLPILILVQCTHPLL